MRTLRTHSLNFHVLHAIVLIIFIILLIMPLVLIYLVTGSLYLSTMFILSCSSDSLELLIYIIPKDLQILSYLLNKFQVAAAWNYYHSHPFIYTSNWASVTLTIGEKGFAEGSEHSVADWWISVVCWSHYCSYRDTLVKKYTASTV